MLHLLSLVFLDPFSSLTMSQNSSFLERMGVVGSIYAIKTGIVSIQAVFRLLSPSAAVSCLSVGWKTWFWGLSLFFYLEQILGC